MFLCFISIPFYQLKGQAHSSHDAAEQLCRAVALRIAHRVKAQRLRVARRGRQPDEADQLPQGLVRDARAFVISPVASAFQHQILKPEP